MRFYRIEITKKDGSPVVPRSLKGGSLSSILPGGQFNPGALNVEFDIPVGPYHLPLGDAFLKIEGLSLADIGNAFDLNNMDISIYGGMSKGLPLANPAQQGLLLQGAVFNAYGNWVGTSQSVDMTFAAATGTQREPKNFVLNWPMGTTLQSALGNTLKTALPDAQQDIRISSRLVVNYDQPHVAGTLNDLAAFVNVASRKIIPDANYPGVNITYNGAKITVADQSTPSSVKAIDFADLIGQPTWRAPLLIQMKTVMRGDLFLQDRVSLPAGPVTNTQAALTRFSSKSSFTGNYIILSIHHYGNFRQPDGASWATVFDMTPELKSV